MDKNISKNTEQEILEGTFAYLVKCGLENISIRDLCKHLRLTQGALYYWFEDKEDLISQAAEYGLKNMTDNIFNYFYANVHDIDNFFESCLDNMDKVKDKLKIIYQMASSPVYGEMLRKSTHRFGIAYTQYAHRFADATGGDIKEIKPLIHLFAALTVDYAVWQDRDEAQIQLDYIKQRLKSAMMIKEDTG